MLIYVGHLKISQRVLREIFLLARTYSWLQIPAANLSKSHLKMILGITVDFNLDWRRFNRYFNGRRLTGDQFTCMDHSWRQVWIIYHFKESQFAKYCWMYWSTLHSEAFFRYCSLQHYTDIFILNFGILCIHTSLFIYKPIISIKAVLYE